MKLINYIGIFLFSITICIFCVQSSKHKNYVVPGTVVYKNTENVYYKHYRNMSTRYIMCVKPNDTNKFKHYSLYVDYTTYCTHNVGDKIAFSVSEAECLRDFKHYALIKEIFPGIVFSVFATLSFLSFIGILKEIIESYSKLNEI